MTRPAIASAFPVVIPSGFVPEVTDAVNSAHRPCPCQQAPYKPKWGGGFTAPRGPKKLKHHAIDIMGPVGALIVAPAAGLVSKVDHTPKGGHCLYLKDERGYTWYFAHLNADPLVFPGDRVEVGQQIGYLGRSGNASRTRRDGSVYGCPHLHMSLTSPTGRKADPAPLLAGLPGAPSGPLPK